MSDIVEPDRVMVRSRLEEMWCDHLLLDEAQADVDFFAAGGDSLAAVALLTEVIDVFCPEADITEMPLDELSIEMLCDYVIEQLRLGTAP